MFGENNHTDENPETAEACRVEFFGDVSIEIPDESMLYLPCDQERSSDFTGYSLVNLLQDTKSLPIPPMALL